MNTVSSHWLKIIWLNTRIRISPHKRFQIQNRYSAFVHIFVTFINGHYNVVVRGNHFCIVPLQSVNYNDYRLHLLSYSSLARVAAQAHGSSFDVAARPSHCRPNDSSGTPRLHDRSARWQPAEWLPWPNDSAAEYLRGEILSCSTFGFAVISDSDG